MAAPARDARRRPRLGARAARRLRLARSGVCSLDRARRRPCRRASGSPGADSRALRAAAGAGWQWLTSGAGAATSSRSAIRATRASCSKPPIRRCFSMRAAAIELLQRARDGDRRQPQPDAARPRERTRVRQPPGPAPAGRRLGAGARHRRRGARGRARRRRQHDRRRRHRAGSSSTRAGTARSRSSIAADGLAASASSRSARRRWPRTFRSATASSPALARGTLVVEAARAIRLADHRAAGARGGPRRLRDSRLDPFAAVARLPCADQAGREAGRQRRATSSTNWRRSARMRRRGTSCTDAATRHRSPKDPVLDALGFDPISLDELIARTGRSAAELRRGCSISSCRAGSPAYPASVSSASSAADGSRASRAGSSRSSTAERLRCGALRYSRIHVRRARVPLRELLATRRLPRARAADAQASLRGLRIRGDRRTR